MREPFSDEPRGARREGHDRDHRVYARRGRHEASIADPEIPYVMRLAGRLRGRGLRVGAPPRGAHRVGREQGHPVLSDPETTQPIDEGIELRAANRRASVPDGTFAKVQRPDTKRAGRPLNPRSLLQAGRAGWTVSGREAILEDRLAIGIDRHAAFGDVAHEDNGRRSPV